MTNNSDIPIPTYLPGDIWELNKNAVLFEDETGAPSWFVDEVAEVDEKKQYRCMVLRIDLSATELARLSPDRGADFFQILLGERTYLVRRSVLLRLILRSQ